MMLHRILQGDVLKGLASLPDGSVHAVITSPPYLWVRDYGTGHWEGGDQDCEHDTVPARGGRGGSGPGSKNTEGSYSPSSPRRSAGNAGHGTWIHRSAWRPA